MKPLPIESLVSNYVKKHKRISLPGLGFLEIKLSPAEVDQKNHTIHPPRQTVQFYKTEKQEENDLFIIYVGQHLKLLQDDVIERLRHFAYLVTESTQQGIFEIPDIGYFIQNEDKNLDFHLYENAQIISQGYGLPDLVVDENTSSSQKENNEDDDISINEENTKKNKQKNRYVLILIFVLIFGAALSYILLMPVGLLQHKTDSKIQDIQTQITDIYKPPASDSTTLQDSSVSVLPKDSLSASDPQEEMTSDISSEIQETKKPIRNSDIVKIPNQRYYIIIAGFDALSKAKRQQERWKAKYNTKIIIKDGKFRISIADFASREQADAQLPIYRKNWKGAWKLFF